jgi:hypothetical protein
VLVDAPEGTVVNCRRTAMVGKVPRQLTGEFSLTVGPATLSVDGIEVDQQVTGTKTTTDPVLGGCVPGSSPAPLLTRMIYGAK